MLLFEFQISDATDIAAFFKFMREKYPNIIGRKRFCCNEEEATKELLEDCSKFGVTLRVLT
jgi:hypothetical protein